MHERVVASRRRAIPTGTWGFHDETSSGGHAKGSLAVERLHGAVRELEPKAHWRAREAAAKAKGRRERALATHRGVRLVSHLRGRGDVALSTDAIMALMRGD